jgi:hypothetical protein
LAGGWPSAARSHPRGQPVIPDFAGHPGMRAATFVTCIREIIPPRGCHLSTHLTAWRSGTRSWNLREPTIQSGSGARLRSDRTYITGVHRCLQNNAW